MSYQTARQNAATVQAYNTLNSYFARGREEGMALFEKIRKLIIVDYMVFTKDMLFTPDSPLIYRPTLKAGGADKTLNFTVHPHALRQMATCVNIPSSFVNTLVSGADWERRELTDLLTERFNKLDFAQRGGGGDRFMNRVVDNEVRGFVSRMFARHISSAPILEAFVKACGKYGAMPASVLTTDVSFTLRCFLPHVFEPADGEFIAIGCSCSNSDFGAGMLRLGLSVLRIKNGSVSYVKETYAASHRSRADNSADLSVELSQSTIKKQILAKQGEVEDIVTSTLHPDKVNDFLDTVAKAMEKKISWYKLEKYLTGTSLSKEEREEIQRLLEKGDESGMLPPVSHDVDGSAIANLWWASSVVSQIAEKQTDDGKKGDLQALAGALLLR